MPTILVDDLRSFTDERAVLVARSGAEGVVLLDRHRGEHIDELWLDHDLGGTDTVWPVVALLERAAFDGEPFSIGTVVVHSANPPGVAALVQALGRWGYRARPAPGVPAVAYR
ncbi:cyclic-phosphate processing receiver domain-containing protein [Catenuloplanes indicus]|uniref:Cyclic-phosphate processing Receiver domain-containing protein n=1 Tax=Catenuloplanes indicus TaxID=137267 RepID=A0AAE3W8A2_9ACTN|nr:cyclic-phosphate processing receiver domain-containing protein [Catenuloplanes indicus]MDQ0370300.1 hypothetical protein [Catenuloplanes indicus]